MIPRRYIEEWKEFAPWQDEAQYALTNLDPDIENIVKCYQEYMSFSVDKPPTRKQFLRNMEQKIGDSDFQGDIISLLRPGVEYDPEQTTDICIDQNQTD